MPDEKVLDGQVDDDTEVIFNEGPEGGEELSEPKTVEKAEETAPTAKGEEKSGKDETSEDGAKTPVEGEGKEVDPVQLRINKVILEKNIAVKEAEKERLKRVELEAKVKEATKEVLPDIPEVPNYMDPDYAKKMEERDGIIVKHSMANAAQQAALRAQQQDNLRKQEEHVAQVNADIETFDLRTDALKLKKSDMTESQNVVGSYITGKSELARYLLSDENGPLNVLYLSQNLAEMEKVSKMSETQAAAYIATTVTPLAAGLKPKQTDAPDPPYVPSGRKAATEEDPNLEGCTFT